MKSAVRLAVSFLLLFGLEATEEKKSKKEAEITCVSEFDYDYKTLKKVVELEHELENIKNNTESHQQMLGDIIQRVTSLEEKQTAAVAFTAVISSSGLTDLGSGAAIVFETVITNIGQSYDSNTGIFTAPVNGLYVFEMDIMTRKAEDRYLQMVKNGAHVMWFYGSALGAEYFVSGSRLVTLQLQIGDRVWIRTRVTDRTGGAVHGNGYSSFSGWLQKYL